MLWGWWGGGCSCSCIRLLLLPPALCLLEAGEFVSLDLSVGRCWWWWCLHGRGRGRRGCSCRSLWCRWRWWLEREGGRYRTLWGLWGGLKLLDLIGQGRDFAVHNSGVVGDGGGEPLLDLVHGREEEEEDILGRGLARAQECGEFIEEGTVNILGQDALHSSIINKARVDERVGQLGWWGRHRREGGCRWALLVGPGLFALAFAKDRSGAGGRLLILV